MGEVKNLYITRRHAAGRRSLGTRTRLPQILECIGNFQGNLTLESVHVMTIVHSVGYTIIFLQ